MVAHPPLFTTKLMLLIVALLLPATTLATCQVAYEYGCDSVNFTAVQKIFFKVDSTPTNADYETYNVTVIMHWGEDNITVGPTAYTIGEPVGLENKYQYTNEGYYQVASTVIFEDDRAAGCSGKTEERETNLKMERTPNRCKWNVQLPAPTGSPTITMGPSVSSSPSAVPTQSGAVVVKKGVVDTIFGIMLVGALVANLV